MQRAVLEGAAHVSGNQTVVIVSTDVLPMQPCVVELVAKVVARSQNSECLTHTIGATYMRSIGCHQQGGTQNIVAKRGSANLLTGIGASFVVETLESLPFISVQFNGKAGEELDVECELEVTIV